MGKVQIYAAVIALASVTLILVATFISIATESQTAEHFLTLTASVLSWPVAAGGLVFGGGQAIAKIFKNS